MLRLPFNLTDSIAKPGARTLAGMGLMVVSTASMACMYVAIRSVPGDMHPFEMVFFRNLFGLILLVGLQARKGRALLRTTRLRLHLLRGVLNLLGMLAFFYALFLVPLAEASILVMTSPLYASLLAIFFLGEPARGHRLLVMGLGFSGAIIILRPGFGAVNPGALILLASAAVWACALIVIKLLSRTESSVTTTTYMVVVMTPLSGLATLAFWQAPSLEQLAWLVLAALLGTSGQFCLAQAFKLAEATAVLPLDFLKLIWAGWLGFIIFAEVPDSFTVAGGIIIFLSSTYLALREAR